MGGVDTHSPKVCFNIHPVHKTQLPAMSYTHVAVFIHWVTAVVIIGLLAVGKFMTSLEVDDALRFTLTQSHKTFGILVLLLSAVRVLWRIAHRAPPHPAHAPAWEKHAASLSHLGFYALIFILPLSGWAMVSVSSLNIDTYLFDTIKLAHLPLLEWLNISDVDTQDHWEHRFHNAHAVAGNVLIVLLLVHIGAALKHHFIDQDDVLRRMKPRIAEPGFLGVLAFVALAIGGSVYALNNLGHSGSRALVASGSSVIVDATISSQITQVEFSETSITANIDLDNPNTNSLSATVNTATATSKNLQALGSLPGADWFDVENYPTATFEATEFVAGQNVNTLDVSGKLTIKDTTLPVAFTLTVDTDANTGESSASAVFPIDRFEFKLGLKSQSNEDYVQSKVLITVNFDLTTGL